MNGSAPVIEKHGRFDVAREDLLPGGTKSRYVDVLFEGCDEVVYASPAQGAAQIALAIKAKELHKLCTIFCPYRGKKHANTLAAQSYGAKIVETTNGMWSVVSARAREYAGLKLARLAPFGLRVPEAAGVLAFACDTIAHNYDEVWVAAGSGTIAAALCYAFPDAKIYAVSVGHRIKEGEAGRALVLRYDGAFSKPAPVLPPFPSNETFDAKAWLVMTQASRPSRRALFWNVDKEHGHGV